MSSFDTPIVLVVSADQTQTVSINPRLLFMIKPLLAVLAVLVAGLLAALSLLGVRYFNERQQFATTTRELQKQVLDLQNFTSAEINTKLEALKKSEKLVLDLQNYLKDRGVSVKPCAIVCVIGSNIAIPGVLARAAQALAEAKVNINCISQTLRQVNMQFLVDRDNYKPAIVALNRALCLPSRATVPVA